MNKTDLLTLVGELKARVSGLSKQVESLEKENLEIRKAAFEQVYPNLHEANDL